MMLVEHLGAQVDQAVAPSQALLQLLINGRRRRPQRGEREAAPRGLYSRLVLLLYRLFS